MRKFLGLGAVVAALGGMPGVSQADTLFQIAPDPLTSASDSCLFNLACSTAANFAPTYVAQEFSLAEAATLQSASFNTRFSGSSYGTAANWMVLSADGAGGLPGSLIASGIGASLLESAGPVIGVGELATVNYTFNTGAISLSAGTNYYLAFQEISTDVDDYLSNGVAPSGLAQTSNGGTTWTTGYAANGATSVAVTLYGAAAASVPEPATLVIFVTAVGTLVLRRRARR